MLIWPKMTPKEGAGGGDNRRPDTSRRASTTLSGLPPLARLPTMVTDDDTDDDPTGAEDADAAAAANHAPEVATSVWDNGDWITQTILLSAAPISRQLPRRYSKITRQNTPKETCLVISVHRPHESAELWPKLVGIGQDSPDFGQI